MELLLYIAVLIAAVAFAVLVIYTVMTLKSMQRTMMNATQTLENLESQMEGVTTETSELLEKTNKLADDVNQKSEKLNGLFDSAQGIGKTASDLNGSLQKWSDSVSKAAAYDQDKASEALKWGNAVVDFWRKKKNK
ncbi:DUF948 domain-containing protein [Lentibacillus halophilus]|uniref:DUF948 domain-containing protein n=1 Tax=Lentibacillus halophilus TaxID=295065 RepID=A0ABN0Z2J9_9BACI